MDTSAIAGGASAFSSANVGDSSVQLSVLKKAMNAEAQGVLSLIDALPKSQPQPATNLPSHLGQNINTTA